MNINKSIFRRVGYFAAVMIASFAFQAGVLAQSAGGLLVDVTDGSGNAVAGASVELSIGGVAIQTVTTGSDGKAAFVSVKDGNYDLAVTANGFAAIIRPVTIAGNSSPQADIELKPGSINENVTVTATRTQITADETAVPVSVVGQQKLEELSVNTVGDVFRFLPGTSTVNEGAFQVRPRIRGLDSNRVLILVDGERLNNSRTSTGQSGVESGLVDTSDVEAVEVVRGSGSVLYGTDALGGTVNIITRDTPARRIDGFRFGGRMSTLFSSNEKNRRGSIAVNGSGKYFAFNVSQSLERSNNYFTGKPTSEFLQDLRSQSIGITDDGELLNSQSHGSNTSAAARYFINDTNTIKASYDRRRAGNIGSPGLVSPFNGFFPFSNRDKVGLRYDSAAITRQLLRLSVSAFYQTQYRNFTNILTVPGFYQYSETVTDTKTAGFDVQTDWKLGSRNALTAGASFFRDVNNDRRKTIAAPSPTAPPFSTSFSKSVPNASLANYAFFAQDDFRVSRRLKITGGVRYDNFKTKSDPTTGFSLPLLRADQISDLGIGGLAMGLDITNTAVTGDIGAVYKLTNNFTASARVGRSFRTPNIFEIFYTDAGSVGGYVVGNPGLKPETGINLDATLRYNSKRLTASVTYFNNNYRNFLSTPAANDSRGCPIYIVRPGTVYDSANCNIVTSPPGPAPVRVYQTQNIDSARIQGVEAEFEMPIRIKLGYLTPNGNFSFLHGDDTSRNVPLDVISPFRANVGFRWQNFGRNYFFDYTARLVARQDRLSEGFLLLPVNQGGGSQPGFATHNITGGYYIRRDRYNFNIHLGISNLTNKAYSEQFVFAPARGRSFTIGTSIEIK